MNKIQQSGIIFSYILKHQLVGNDCVKSRCKNAALHNIFASSK